MTTATQEIRVRIAKTIQEAQFEPVTAEVIITETCPKKKYAERLDELINLASEKVYGYMSSEEELPEGEEIPAGEGEYEEGGEMNGKESFEGGEEDGQGGGNFEEGSVDEGKEGQGEEGGFLLEEDFEGGEEDQGEEGDGEEGSGFEEGGEESDDGFGDFFENDPGGEVE